MDQRYTNPLSINVGEDGTDQANHFSRMTQNYTKDRAVYIPGSHSAVVLGTINSMPHALTVLKVIETSESLPLKMGLAIFI